VGTDHARHQATHPQRLRRAVSWWLELSHRRTYDPHPGGSGGGSRTQPGSAGEIPWLHRCRWPYNELRIRDLIHGANLNVNYGYAYVESPNRTRQREWETAQERVAVTERQLANHQTAVHHLRQRLADLQDAYTIQRHNRKRLLVQQRLDLQRRQRLGQAITRALQRLAALSYSGNISSSLECRLDNSSFILQIHTPNALPNVLWYVVYHTRMSLSTFSSTRPRSHAACLALLAATPTAPIKTTINPTRTMTSKATSDQVAPCWLISITGCTT
jgi:hypothetical protein